MSARRGRRAGAWRVLRAPALAAAAGAAGLALSLVGEGAADLAGAALLAGPALWAVGRLGPRRPPRAAAPAAAARAAVA